MANVMEVNMRRNKKVVAVAAASGATLVARAIAKARRRSKLDQTRAGFAELVMPMVSSDTPPPDATPAMDEAHAPGHRHLHMTPEVAEKRAPRPVRNRPFSKQTRGLRHPGRR